MAAMPPQIPPPPSTANWSTLPPPSAPSPAYQPVQPPEQSGVLTAAAIILMVLGGLEAFVGLAALLHGRLDGMTLFLLALGGVSAGGGLGLIQDSRVGGVLGVIGAVLQLLISLPLIPFAPIVGVGLAAANAFALWAITTSERRLRSNGPGTSVDPWTNQPMFSTASQPKFGSKPWHKVAMVVLAIIGGLFAFLVIYGIVAGTA